MTLRRIVKKEPKHDLWARPKTYIGDAVAYPLFCPVDGGYLVPPFSPGAKHKKDKKTSLSSTQKFNAKLRPYQKEPVKEALRTLALKQGAILRAQCGSGKTVMGLAVSTFLGGTVVILVDQLNIAEQWKDRIEEFLPEASCKIYSGSHTSVKKAKEHDNIEYKIIVAQALCRQDWANNSLKCSLLIVDEAHVFSAPSFIRAIHNIEYDYSLGLTATDDRKDELDWVFRWFLGTEIVEADAPTLPGRVKGVSYQPPYDDSDFFQAYCVRNRKFTWPDNCRACPYYEDFPTDCGGRLPYSKLTRSVSWDSKKVNYQGLVKAILNENSYIEFCTKVINKILVSGRRAFVFCQFKDPLKRLYTEFQFNDDCGIYVGDIRNKKALTAQITFTTYAMSNKALDVPDKDTAFIMSPASDIRQTVGRIIRFKAGKKDPIVIDPDIEGSYILGAMRRKRFKQYRDMGFKV